MACYRSCLAAVSRHLCFFFSLFPVSLRITHRSRAELAFHRPFFSAPWFEGNLLRFARARAHVRALMTQKSCAVEMRNAILRNYLNRSFERPGHGDRMEDLKQRPSDFKSSGLKKVSSAKPNFGVYARPWFFYFSLLFT